MQTNDVSTLILIGQWLERPIPFPFDRLRGRLAEIHGWSQFLAGKRKRLDVLRRVHRTLTIPQRAVKGKQLDNRRKQLDDQRKSARDDLDRMIFDLLNAIDFAHADLDDDEISAVLGKEWRLELKRNLDQLAAILNKHGVDAPDHDEFDRLCRALLANVETLSHTKYPKAIEAVGPRTDGARDDSVPTSTDPTMDDLCGDPIISTDTFRRVRNAAGIEVKLKGAAARNRRYTSTEVDRLITAARAGNFIERVAMAEKWAKFGSK